ncbi:MAG: RNB domain-containing ribonuclease, partial [Acidimicrobiales bacterium]|nr:RNB domain-containing ribonuclease [Acidimicrobiales bacterium]
MPSLCVRCPHDDDFFESHFVKLRQELDIPASFPEAVEQEAAEAVRRGPVVPPGAASSDIADRRDIDFVTIDPPTSLDLDQAFASERRGNGYRVFYAIADVAAFVTPGGAIDAEARARGVTLYSPDINTLLHPAILAENGASLLAAADRQAIVWTLDLDSDGKLVGTDVRRALVRSRAKLSYQEAQDQIDSQTAPESLALLAEIGRLRQQLERERGAVSLNLPSQEVVHEDDHYRLEYDISRPIENWNAQISLLTGIAAASLMVGAKVGLLRTLPEPYDRTVKRIRRSALALGIEWPKAMPYAERVRDLDPNDPKHAALLNQAARGLRGAGYVGFVGELPEYTRHAAIAADYAHVTAPLRRVCDRFANEIVLNISADREPPEWAVSALDELPSVMGKARSRDRSLERAVVDLAEAVSLAHRIGHYFPGVVV